MRTRGERGRALVEYHEEVGAGAHHGRQPATGDPQSATSIALAPRWVPAIGHPASDQSFSRTRPDGHIAPTTDFRSMYAGILNDWMAGDSTAILGGTYSPVPLFSSGPH